MIQLYKERCEYADYIIYNTVSKLESEFFSIDELFTDEHGVLFIKNNTWDEPLAVLDSWYIESVDDLGVVFTFEEMYELSLVHETSTLDEMFKFIKEDSMFIEELKK